ncbi:DUF3558 domain-containing protein [Pseudonocardiaceae bacterium YIM PH 21723]|nr:DUF3558 domain-containing protein [Pseudonocardiaceae bacterium YIM PH 21723]
MLAVGLLAVGCNGGGSTPTSSSAAPTSSTSSLPQRPKELKSAASAKPCELLTQDFLAQHGLTRPPQAQDKDVTISGPSCTFLNGDVRGPGAVVGISSKGVSTLAPGNVGADSSSAAIDVAGFHGYQAGQKQPDSSGDTCIVGLDVAEGHALIGQAADTSNPPRTSHEQLCTLAKQTAEAALNSLSAKG